MVDEVHSRPLHGTEVASHSLLGHALGVIAALRGLCRVQYLHAVVSVAALAEGRIRPAAACSAALMRRRALW